MARLQPYYLHQFDVNKHPSHPNILINRDNIEKFGLLRENYPLTGMKGIPTI